MLSKTKCRQSVTGWFHGKSVRRTPFPADSAPPTLPPTDISEEEFISLVNLEYADPATQTEIQEKFEEESEIQLSDFIAVSNE